MKQMITYLFLCLLIMAGCKKEDQTPSTLVTLNDNSSSWNIKDFAPAYTFSVDWDPNNLYGSAQDSLDLDDDGQYDVAFHLNLLNQDSIHLLGGGTPSPFPGFNAYSSGWEIASEKELMYAGLGTVVTFYWIKPLMIGYDLTNHDVWKTSANIWQENPIPLQLSFGPWYSIQDIRYIGLKKNRTFGDIVLPLYSWIELDCTDRQNPKIVRMAVHK
jgi:hypothetical protein